MIVRNGLIKRIGSYLTTVIQFKYLILTKKLDEGVIGIVLLAGMIIVIFSAGIYLASKNINKIKKVQETEKSSVSLSPTYSPDKPSVTPNQSPTNKPTITYLTKTPTQKPTPTSPLSYSNGNFQIYGVKEIEGGATIQLVGIGKNAEEHAIKARLIFANPGSSAKTVDPSRTTISSTNHLYYPHPIPEKLVLQPKQSKTYDFIYSPEDEPPYLWIYANTSGSQVELGRLERW